MTIWTKIAGRWQASVEKKRYNAAQKSARRAALIREVEELRNRVASNKRIKVGSFEWDRAVARCLELRIEIASLGHSRGQKSNHHNDEA